MDAGSFLKLSLHHPTDSSKDLVQQTVTQAYLSSGQLQLITWNIDINYSKLT